MVKANKKELKKLNVAQELSSDEFDSDMDIYADSDDGIFYEDGMDGLFVEDEDLMFEDSDEDMEYEDGDEFDLVEDDEEDIDMEESEEEVPELIPASDHENGVKVSSKAKSIKTSKDTTVSTVAKDFLNQGIAAIKALAGGTKKNGEKKTLFPESHGVFLHVTYKLPLKMDVQIQGNRRYFQLPSSEKSPLNSSLCLVLPDLFQSKKDRLDHEVDKQSNMWIDILREKYGVSTGVKIFTLNQLRREYKTQEEKRKFSQTYDILLVDRTVLRPVMYHLQKWVQKQGRMPIPFNITKKNVPDQIKRAYSIGQYDIRPGNTDAMIRIGNTTQSAKELISNFTNATECLLKNIPGGEDNIRLADIRTDMAQICLPIYVDFETKKNVAMPMVKLSKPEPIIEDLDTLLPGYKIKMDGVDFVVVDEDGNEVDYPFDDDEVNNYDDIPVPSKSDFTRSKAKEQLQEKKKEAINDIKNERIVLKRLKNIVKRGKKTPIVKKISEAKKHDKKAPIAQKISEAKKHDKKAPIAKKISEAKKHDKKVPLTKEISEAKKNDKKASIVKKHDKKAPIAEKHDEKAPITKKISEVKKPNKKAPIAKEISKAKKHDKKAPLAKKTSKAKKT